MTATVRAHRPEPVGADRPRTLVWIDARSAAVVRRADGDVTIEHLLSDVPPHHRSTGHVRHDAARHGGVGPRSAGETHRLELLARFVATVAARVPPEDDVTVIGPGTVPERLAHVLRDDDAHHRHARAVTVAPAPRQTDRQLVARIHREAGREPRRPTHPPTVRPTRRPEPAEGSVIREALEAEA